MTFSLLSIDSTTNALVLQGGVGGSPSPNGGVLTTLSNLGVDPSANVGMDISALSGRTFASIVRNGQTAAELYLVNLGTGFSLGRHGTIGSSTVTTDIAAPLLDLTAPTITVAIPAPSRVTTSRSRINFSGTTADDQQVVSVEYRTVRGGRAGSYKLAAGTDRFSFAITGLSRGRTSVQIRATDLSGNVSSRTSVVVTRR